MENRNHLFQPGQSGNPAGRPKGSPNQTTAMVRELFASILQEEQDNFREALERLRVDSPKDYIQVLTTLTKKFLPDMHTTILQNADGTNIEPIQIILPPNPSNDE